MDPTAASSLPAPRVVRCHICGCLVGSAFTRDPLLNARTRLAFHAWKFHRLAWKEFQETVR